ncbi:MAG: hypothetical protein HUK03_09015, partial [Bacteroidaceae bacterium]|nr:hypothetical protein [Bacteroidaceae bacterium]
NWNDKTRSTLKEDYKTMIRAFQALDTSPTIYMCLPCYLPEGNTHGSDASLTSGVIPTVKAVAKEMGVEVIDCHTPFVGRDWLLGDLLHPNDLGYTLLSYVIGSHIKKNYPKPKTGAFWTVAKQSRLSFLEEEPTRYARLTDNSSTTYEMLPAATKDTLQYQLTEPIIATAYSITCGTMPDATPKSWTLYASLAGTSWTKVHEVKNADFNPHETRLFALPSTTTARRYWRFVITTGDSVDSKIHELQLFGAPRSMRQSLLRGGGGTWSAQAQTVAGQGVEKLSDGKMGADKYCTQVESGTTLWVQYDAPEEWTVTGYGLISGDYTRRDRWPTSWTLTGSNDGKTWKTIDTRSSQFFGGVSSLMEYEISAPASYKSYRLTFRNLTAGSYLELSELQLYGSPTTAVTSVQSSAILPTPWYRLDGTASAQPAGKGIFIKDGKKVARLK